MTPKKQPVELEFKPRSCWDVYATKKDRKAMDAMAKDYLAFLTRCKTERETVAYVREKALAAGFVEGVPAKAKTCFRSFKGKTIFLARKGRRPLREGFRLLAAHADTPRLDLKQRPLYEECEVGLAKTHYYGGIRKYQWLARPLALHGVVALSDGRTVEVCIGENEGDPVLTIADLLPHLAQKQVEKKVSEAFEGEKLNIVMGHAPVAAEEGNGRNGNGKRIKRQMLELLHARYGIAEADLYSAELQAVPAGPARPVGLDGSLLGGYGQDDRACVFGSLAAFLAEDTPEHCQIVLFYDKEEIGSEGATSARSHFFEYCLRDLAEVWDKGVKPSEIYMNSKAISADVHAPIDPDYQDLHEKLNSALLGFGPCFCKFTGHRGKVGANDAHAEYVGWLRGVMDKAGVPWQMAELGKVDQGGGGTVAKFLAVYGMDVIDFGPPVLSMHSPFELTSKADMYALALALRAFLRS